MGEKVLTFAFIAQAAAQDYYIALSFVRASIPTMKIVADENIPFLSACFAGVADIVTRPGRHISSDDVQDADALLVRSVTPVNKALIGGSSLQFVATATAGIDHIDQQYLAEQGVGFAYASGCNATAVSEYVLAALDCLSEKYRLSLPGKTAGVVGYGQVGRRVAAAFTRLGLHVVISDPLCEPVPGVAFVPLDSLIQQSDIIALHTPLTVSGIYPTHHLMGASKLAAMKEGAVLISAGRGAVVDNQALKASLAQGKDIKVVMDVWEGEPSVDNALLAQVDIATPHIAGYSLDGKIAGTVQIYQAFCQHFGLPEQVDTDALYPSPDIASLTFNDSIAMERAASTAIRAVYDIRRDDAWMRQIASVTREKGRVLFDQMRKEYPTRREFGTLRTESDNRNIREHLAAQGFST